MYRFDRACAPSLVLHRRERAGSRARHEQRREEHDARIENPRERLVREKNKNLEQEASEADAPDAEPRAHARARPGTEPREAEESEKQKHERRADHERGNSKHRPEGGHESRSRSAPLEKELVERKRRICIGVHGRSSSLIETLPNFGDTPLRQSERKIILAHEGGVDAPGMETRQYRRRIDLRFARDEVRGRARQDAHVAEDALDAVPRSYRDGSLALGATEWQTIWKVTLPAARSGVLMAVMLGIGRIIGETIIVMMVTGNAPVMPTGLGALFSPIRTMTATIAAEMGEVAKGSTHYNVLFFIGIILFMISLVINITASAVVIRTKKRSERILS